MTTARATFMLYLATAISAATGLAMMLAVLFDDQLFIAFFLDLAFLPLDGAQAMMDDAARLTTAISGGLLFGFAVMAWQVTREVYRRDQAAGRRILLPAIIGWFVVDGSGSLAAGAPFNVVLNTAFLALFLVPLLLNHRQSAPAV
ncbi:MAG: excinuclease ABC subunit A [Paracoccaceae bacterium]